MYDDYYGDDDEPSRGRRLLIGVAVVGLAAAGWYFVRPALTDADEPGGTAALEFDTPASADPGTSGPQSLKAAAGNGRSTVATTSATTSATTTPTPTTTSLPTSPPPAADASDTYSTMPDGSPVPVVAILDDDRITLSGAVPSEAAAEQLVALSTASSAIPDLRVDDRLTVNPAVPVGVGVRLLELHSAPFREGSARIEPEHGQQLDRLSALMNQFPRTTVVVVGHADQRGSDADNLVLSQRRAEAVVAYLVDHGINGSRLSSRAVGEADLLTIDDDEASLALNRRTEFIIFGLLTGPAPSTADAPPEA